MRFIETFDIEEKEYACKKELGDPVWHDESDIWSIEGKFNFPDKVNKPLSGILLGKSFGWDPTYSSITICWEYDGEQFFIFKNSTTKKTRYSLNYDSLLGRVLNNETFNIRVTQDREKNQIMLSGSFFSNRIHIFVFHNGPIKTPKRGFFLYPRLLNGCKNESKQPLKFSITYESYAVHDQ